MNLLKTSLTLVLLQIGVLNVLSQDFPPTLSTFIDPCHPGVTTWQELTEACSIPNQQTIILDYPNCQLPADPNDIMMSSIPVQGQNQWQVVSPAQGEDCMPVLTGNGSPSITELLIDGIPFNGGESFISFELGYFGPLGVQSAIKVLLIPDGQQPQEVMDIPMPANNGFQPIGIPLPPMEPGDQVLLVGEDFSQTQSGEMNIAIKDLTIVISNESEDGCESLFLDENGNVISLPYWIEYVISPPQLTECHVLSAIEVRDQNGNVINSAVLEQGYDYSSDISIVQAYSQNGCGISVIYFYREDCDDGDPCTLDFCQ
ncbi:MAG: hypothetical protein AAF193_00555, partial [Bacteroidota bacterium]